MFSCFVYDKMKQKNFSKTNGTFRSVFPSTICSVKEIERVTICDSLLLSSITVWFIILGNQIVSSTRFPLNFAAHNPCVNGGTDI